MSFWGEVNLDEAPIQSGPLLFFHFSAKFDRGWHCSSSEFVDVFNPTSDRINRSLLRGMTYMSSESSFIIIIRLSILPPFLLCLSLSLLQDY